MEIEPKTTRRRRLLHITIALGCLIAALVYTSYAIENRPTPAYQNQPAAIPVVSVIEAPIASYQATLQGNGEAEPHFTLELTTEVAGRVMSVAEALQSGEKVNSNQVLATIDPIAYQQSVASAEQSLAQAQVEFLQEQHQARQSRDEWQQSGLGNQPDSPLVLRDPQLAAAKASVKLAQSMLKQAKQDLLRTQIQSPFDALVVKRHVSPGQYLQPGDPIATLYSTDRIDVRISLPLRQWSLLPDPKDLIDKKRVTLTSNHGAKWQGTVRRIERHIDKGSRQRSLVVSIDQPMRQTPPLLAGTFLQATLTGTAIDTLLAVPASSMTAKGDIWYIDVDEKLSRFKANILFQQDGTLFVEAPELFSDTGNSEAIPILTTPLSGYLPGQTVKPRVIAKEDS